ncbi:hypothetical protein C8Q79DRAFT_984103 [Trametes meyenii]|nr:hypothetical protein C8Q79DRAFT_984103 [Trametes meyenii]
MTFMRRTGFEYIAPPLPSSPHSSPLRSRLVPRLRRPTYIRSYRRTLRFIHIHTYFHATIPSCTHAYASITTRLALVFTSCCLLLVVYHAHM